MDDQEAREPISDLELAATPSPRERPKPRRRSETLAPVPTIPVPKFVPQNRHVPGTIALSLFTHRGLRRP